MKYRKVCECCNHKITAYTISLNKGLVHAFCKFAEKYIAEKIPLKKGEIGLTNAQYSNFQNLRHFNIIWQLNKGEGWHLTDLGKSFYYGESGVLSPAGHLEGETLEATHEAWETHEGKREVVFIKSILPFHYKQRPDYQNEKGSTRQTLFD